MTCQIEFSEVHRQRIREAVRAAREGATVRFRLNPSKRVVWWREGVPRVQHVICAGYAFMDRWLMAVESEFQKQLSESIR